MAVVLPDAFSAGMNATAKANKQHICLPEGHDPRIVKAAGLLLKDGLCTLTILGNPADVEKLAKEADVSIKGATIIDPATAAIDDMVKSFCEARKATAAEATKLLREDKNYFGTMMMHMNKVDGVVSGAACNTADTMRPALQIIKAQPGVSLVSSVFFMLLKDGVKLFSDGGIVIDPSSSELADMALETAKTAQAFGIAPRIAMLSYVTGEDKHPMTLKTREATKLAKEKAPQELKELILGPVQYDAAVNQRVADVKFKGKPGPVAGKASVLIFPDLNCGNITYKATQQASGCVAIGPIMQGLNKPVNDLSRGCTVEDAVAAVVVTCLQAIDVKKKGPASKL